MEILGGLAKGTPLKVPSGMNVRPTAVRSRRALFDMLGDLQGRSVMDIFAGSGALGLEAASRGAVRADLVETSPGALSAIRANVSKVEKCCPNCLFSVIPGKVPDCFRQIAVRFSAPDLIFADPPYAESAELLAALLENESFRNWAVPSTLIWELPDTRPSLKVFPKEWKLAALRELGSSRFLFVKRV